MEDVREEEEDDGIYEWGSDMDGEEYNDLESKRDEAMVSIEGEMGVDDGRNMLVGYMRYYSQPHNGWKPP